MMTKQTSIVPHYLWGVEAEDLTWFSDIEQVEFWRDSDCDGRYGGEKKKRTEKQWQSVYVRLQIFHFKCMTSA
jgi:hypothetical protein